MPQRWRLGPSIRSAPRLVAWLERARDSRGRLNSHAAGKRADQSARGYLARSPGLAADPGCRPQDPWQRQRSTPVLEASPTIAGTVAREGAGNYGDVAAPPQGSAVGQAAAVQFGGSAGARNGSSKVCWYALATRSPGTTRCVIVPVAGSTGRMPRREQCRRPCHRPTAVEGTDRLSCRARRDSVTVLVANSGRPIRFRAGTQ
jgi:hypothetical protein